MKLKMKCLHCKGMAILMKEGYYLKSYYYHYSKDYSKGCHQRISLNNKEQMKSLTTWSKDDEIRNLRELLEAERKKVEYRERVS